MTAPAAPGWAPPETWATPPDRPEPVRRLGLVLVALFRRVVAEPVRDGRLRIRGGPPGLGVLVVSGAVCFVGALLLAAAGPWLRERLSVSVSPVGISAPDRLVWLVVAFVLLAVALVQLAGLHAPWWGRIGALALSGTFLAAAGIQADPGPAALRHAVLAGSGWLALVLLSVLRRRRLFRWWEVVAVLTLLGGPTLITAATTLPEQYAESSGAYVTYAWFLLLNLGALAAPIVLAAGFALAQVSYATVVWGVELIRVGGRPPTPPAGQRPVAGAPEIRSRTNAPRAVLLVALGLVAAWRLWTEITFWLDTLLLSGARVVAAAVMITVGALLWWTLDRIADRRFRGTTRPRHLGEDLLKILVPVAGLLTLDSVLRGLLLAPAQFVALTLDSAGADGAATIVSAGADRAVEVIGLLGTRPGQAVIAVLLVGWAFGLATRGDRGRAELVGLAALMALCRPIFGYEPTTWYLPLVATVAVTLLGVVWAVRRRLTEWRVEALLVSLLLLAAFGSRELFADPLALVLGPAAAVLFGLAWGFVTGAPSGGGVARLPAATAFFLGNSLLGATVVAFIALARNPAGSIDPTGLTLLGDQTLGSGLLLAALLAVMACALRNDPIGRPD